MNADDARLVQRQVAQLSATGSSLRNQGAAGVVAAARRGLTDVNLLLLPRAGNEVITRRRSRPAADSEPREALLFEERTIECRSGVGACCSSMLSDQVIGEIPYDELILVT